MEARLKQGSRPVCTLHEFHRRATSVCFVLLIGMSSSCNRPEEPPPNRPSVTVGSASLTGASLNFAANDPPGEWHSQARDYANTRYSPLDQINTSNAGKLRIAWTFSDATLGGHEAAPLVVDNTMYLVTPFPTPARAVQREFLVCDGHCRGYAECPTLHVHRPAHSAPP